MWFGCAVFLPDASICPMELGTDEFVQLGLVGVIAVATLVYYCKSTRGSHPSSSRAAAPGASGKVRTVPPKRQPLPLRAISPRVRVSYSALTLGRWGPPLSHHRRPSTAVATRRGRRRSASNSWSVRSRARQRALPGFWPKRHGSTTCKPIASTWTSTNLTTWQMRPCRWYF